jgi:hypothetical protein
LLTNVGSIENKGLEFSINAIPFETKDFSWDLGFNMTSIEMRSQNLLLPTAPITKALLLAAYRAPLAIPFKCTA